ncbi:TPA: hypothetical protein DEO28_03770 [Candidatus Dependentiae bacterium]|nr:MAG: PpiC-type peptidyl-prolyl cis-trans isomerase [candidate division TM6 bacterium GW2011_GWE2_31_21]KKP53584.1 MAG: PpiC-type peptidyl-prolyl cis-trans isomerase [candidate division TM6 bacterium GW2011_GWF2_33_332]HBS48176.1 hypothetical protein [Candidatus Dependentiae bacterium]HBZ73600.1 hypothetical protein [Candidatus Dependentiae bacterium]
MITMFRKEFRKWKMLLWAVILSMTIGTLTTFFLRTPAKKETIVGKVNGSPIYYDDYKQELVKVNMQIEMMKNYARAQGISEDWILALTGIQNPQEMAFQEALESKALESILNKFSIEIDLKSLQELIVKSLPAQFINSAGMVDERIYKQYLSHLGMTISEFEEKKENDVKLGLLKSFIKHAAYNPKYSLKNTYLQENSQKDFAILVLPVSKFVEIAKKEKLSEEALNKFYEERKDFYSIPEKRQIEYCLITIPDYEKRIIVDDNMINAFYEKNKDSMFRISPEVKVRRILLKVSSLANENDVKTKAENIYKNLVENKSKFVEFAKKYSEDKKTSINGGLINFFKSGSYDKEFERAAFRLKDKGEISQVIRTKDGFEIIQLEDRLAAKNKPISEVKNDIIKAIKSRKLDNTIKSDLEILIRNAREESQVLDRFMKEKGLQFKKTEFLTENEKPADKLETTLIQKIFAKKSAENNFGYFEYNNAFVLYREAARKAKTVLSLSSVRPQVEQDCCKDAGKNKQAELAATIKKQILDHKGSLIDFQKIYGLQLINTGLVKRDSKVKFEEFEPLLGKAFELSDKGQILELNNKNDIYLVQIENMSVPSIEMIDREIEKIARSEKESGKATFMNSFVASLLRNAKIEKNEEMLNLR